MLDSDTLKKLQNASISERLQTLELIIESLKQDLRNISQPQEIIHQKPLKGKVIHYDAPYQPVAEEDWEATK